MISYQVGPITAYGTVGCFDERWATLLLGEAPNRWMQENGRPELALWREDLADLCGVDIKEFLRLFARANLLPTWPGHSETLGTGAREGGGGRTRGSRFPFDLAMPRARALIETLVDRKASPFLRVILFGRRVARSFGIPPTQPFFELVRLRAFPFVVVPHPSGASHWWNDPANVRTARAWWTRAAKEQRKNVEREVAAEFRRPGKG